MTVSADRLYCAHLTVLACLRHHCLSAAARIETVTVCSVVIRRRWRRIKIVIVRRRYWRVVAVAVCAVIIRERIWSVIIVVIVPNLWTAWKQNGIVLGGTAALGGDQISSIEYDGRRLVKGRSG